MIEKKTRYYTLYNDKGTTIPFFVLSDEDLISVVYRLWKFYSESCDKIQETTPEGRVIDNGVIEFEEHRIAGKVVAGIKWEVDLHDAHYCEEWDGLFIDKFSPEFEITCANYFKNKEK